MLRSLIQLSIHATVQPKWGEWLHRRDDPSAMDASGALARLGGGQGRLSTRAVYAIVTLLIAISCAVNTFSDARDISWRLGRAHNLWEPALWEVTSGLVVVALMPLAWYGAILARAGAKRPLRMAGAITALLVTFSVLHIAGMGLFRELAYRLAGFAYSYPFAHEALYEFRKDLFAYAAIAVIFWLAERPAGAALVAAEAVEKQAAAATPGRPELWLRDGRISILIDPNEIASVSSAGNYVEFLLTGHRSHLIRTTLQAQEARLAPFGIARVHRRRLVNLKRVVALEWRASGDFELRLDTGETLAGSRRFKAAVATIAA
jgi:DNA-binding LytR/AlgR family response regulator